MIDYAILSPAGSGCPTRTRTRSLNEPGCHMTGLHHVERATFNATPVLDPIKLRSVLATTLSVQKELSNA